MTSADGKYAATVGIVIVFDFVIRINLSLHQSKKQLYVFLVLEGIF